MKINDYRFCWYMTEKCHLSCPFCYAFKQGCHPSLSIMRKIGESFIEQDISSVNLAGGEPLLNKLTYQVIQDFHKDINLSITTSAAMRNVDKLLLSSEKLNRVCVSVDNVSASKAKVFRGDNYDVNMVLNNIRAISNVRDNIEINTVLSKKNQSDLVSVGSFLSSLDCNVTWKLFQLTINENNCSLSRDWLISDEDYFNAVSNVNSTHSNVNVIPYSSSRLNKKYVIIRPNGDICLPEINEYKPLGNITTKRLIDIVSPWTYGRIA